jgi:hypothetical protein
MANNPIGLFSLVPNVAVHVELLAMRKQIYLASNVTSANHAKSTNYTTNTGLYVSAIEEN